MLRDALNHIGINYPTASKEQYANHPMARYIRNEFRNELSKALGEEGNLLRTKGGAGASNWPTVPWGAVFNPLVTTSATRGYYVVFLFSAEEPKAYLSLNQGTTTVVKEFGHRRGRQVLRDRATLIRARLQEFASVFPIHSIRLGSVAELPRDYEAGHAIGSEYNLLDLPAEELMRNDLRRMVQAYSTLVYRGGIDATPETDGNETDPRNGASIEEIRRYNMHKRIDRHPAASQEAKKYHGTICQACGFDFGKKYGDLGHGFIEAHHLRPLGSLEEGKVVKYDVATDFAVLCSNCHRMIHRTSDPSDLPAFIRRLGK